MQMLIQRQDQQAQKLDQNSVQMLQFMNEIRKSFSQLEIQVPKKGKFSAQPIKNPRGHMAVQTPGPNDLTTEYA